MIGCCFFISNLMNYKSNQIKKPIQLMLFQRTSHSILQTEIGICKLVCLSFTHAAKLIKQQNSRWYPLRALIIIKTTICTNYISAGTIYPPSLIVLQQPAATGGSDFGRLGILQFNKHKGNKPPRPTCARKWYTIIVLLLDDKHKHGNEHGVACELV